MIPKWSNSSESENLGPFRELWGDEESKEIPKNFGMVGKPVITFHDFFGRQILLSY